MIYFADRPGLAYSPDRRTTGVAWQIVADRSGCFPLVFRYAGAVVRVERSESGALVCRFVSLLEFRALLDRTLDVYRLVGGEEKHCYPPVDLVAMMLHDPEAPIPVLRRIVEAPVFGADGSLRLTRGYSPSDGLLLSTETDALPVPESPSAEDALEARRLILNELLADFPFAAESDRTAAVAVFLLPFARDLIQGPTPLHVAEAPTPASGKGLLLYVCLYPGIGPRGASWIALPQEDDELRKQATTQLLDGRPATIWDNVVGLVRSPVLAKLLTDSEWTDRRLGQNVGVSIPVATIFAMTANNPTFSDELVRRIVPIRLEPEQERPEDRTGFRHADLRNWTEQNRPALIWAAHVIIRRWLALGKPCPSASIPQLGSFEAYRRVMGGILEASGFPDFLANRERLRSFGDPDTERWQAFATLWAERFGDALVKASELAPVAEEAGISVRGDSEKARATALGNLLGQRRQRIFAGFRIELGTGRARRSWRLRKVVGDGCVTSDTHSLSSCGSVEGKDREHGGARGVTGDTGVTDAPEELPLGELAGVER